MSAWLVTKEFFDHEEHSARERIAAILNPRWSAERVRRIVEVLHNSSYYTLSEQAGYANNYAFNPYPVEYGAIEGVRTTGEMCCGHDPVLHARRVSNLRIFGPPNDEEATWDEIEIPPRVREFMRDLRDRDKKPPS